MGGPPHLDFALALERARREAGLSVAALGTAAGVADRTLRRYRSGERLPDPVTVASLERACGMPSGALAAKLAAPDHAAEEPAPPQDPGTAPRRPRSRRTIAAVTAAVAAAVVAAVLLATGDDSPAPRPAGPVERTVRAARGLDPGRAVAERTGGPANTWSDYRIAGGRPGPQLRAEQTVRVACRVRGFVVESGNRWWYALTAKPWDGRFFATADAFYNVPFERGLDFRKTPLVDTAVPICGDG